MIDAGAATGLSSTRADGLNPKLRIGPRHPRLGEPDFAPRDGSPREPWGPRISSTRLDFADDRMHVRESSPRRPFIWRARPPGTHNCVALVEVSQAMVRPDRQQ
jgi:hypothetical protein